METPIAAGQILEAKKLIEEIKASMHQIIVGQHDLIKNLLNGLLANGHILLEGLPGVAKTLAVNTLAKILDLDFKRIQFTPDLLPGDLIGTPVYNSKEGQFEIKKGPIFTNILLADEINRAPAKVQSALLEIMQEKQVTISGTTFPAPTPFVVLATQNPVEQEGTYPLSEAQTDRFMMKIKIDYPSREEEKIILERMGRLQAPPMPSSLINVQKLLELRELADAIYIDEKVEEYILDLVHATRTPDHFQIPIKNYLEYGASPRATIALKQAAKAEALQAGRYFTTPQDVASIAKPVLRHRLRLSYEGEADNLSTDHIVDRILQTLPSP